MLQIIQFGATLILLLTPGSIMMLPHTNLYTEPFTTGSQ